MVTLTAIFDAYDELIQPTHEVLRGATGNELECLAQDAGLPLIFLESMMAEADADLIECISHPREHLMQRVTVARNIEVTKDDVGCLQVE